MVYVPGQSSNVGDPNRKKLSDDPFGLGDGLNFSVGTDWSNDDAYNAYMQSFNYGTTSPQTDVDPYVGNYGGGGLNDKPSSIDYSVKSQPNSLFDGIDWSGTGWSSEGDFWGDFDSYLKAPGSTPTAKPTDPAKKAGTYVGNPSQNYVQGVYNPYADASAQWMYNQFMTKPGEIANQVTQEIANQMNRNVQTNFAYEQGRAQYDLMNQQLANERALYEAKAAEFSRSADQKDQEMANQMKMFADNLALQQQQLAQAMQLQTAQLEQQGQLGNRGYDVQEKTSADQLAALLAQIAQQGQLGNRELDIKADQGTSGQAALDLQKYMFDQQMAQSDADRDFKNSLLAALTGGLGLGGLGGGTGGTGSGGGSGSGSGGSGFYDVKSGQFAQLGDGGGTYATNITAGALPSSTIQAGVSAIEGAPASSANVSGPTAGMTAAQQGALAQDAGSTGYASRQSAATDTMRSAQQANAGLDLNSQQARAGQGLDLMAYLADKERQQKYDQLGNYDLLLQALTKAA